MRTDNQTLRTSTRRASASWTPEELSGALIAHASDELNRGVSERRIRQGLDQAGVADELVDIDLVAWLPDGSRESNKLPDWYPNVVFALQASQRVKLATFCGGKQSTGATVLVLREGR